MDVGVLGGGGGGMWAGILLNEAGVKVQTLNDCREHLDSLKKKQKRRIFLFKAWVSAIAVFFVH